MKKPAIPGDETFRLMALRSLDLLDTAPEESFQTVVETARALFNVPTALVSLIDEDRQWFKARSGLDDTQTSRDISFCAHAILEDQVFVIPDAHEDERFHDNPAVTGAPFVRFYAGAQIRLPSGYTIGTVCIISPEPRHDFGAAQRAQLRGLAGLVVDALAARALRAELDRERTVIERQSLLLECTGAPLALVSSDGTIEDCSTPFADLFKGHAEAGAQLSDVLAAVGTSVDFPPEADSLEVTVEDTALRVEPDGTGYVVYPA